MDRPEPFRDLDWDPKRARELGERALDLWVELLEKLPDLSIGRRERAEEVRAAVSLDVPDEPMPLDDLMAHLRSVVLEHSMYPGHPGFMAYVSGAGTVPGVAGDLIAAAVNQNVGGWRLSPAASEIELNLTKWLAAQFGLPEGSGGLLTSGGAMANFIGLKAARDAKGGKEVRARGVQGEPRMTLYASEEVHSVVDRAADMLGLGTQACRHIAIDDRFRMRPDEVRRSIEMDLTDRSRPIAIVASAGSVATGSIDPLNELADLADEYGLWLHVDGAASWPTTFARSTPASSAPTRSRSTPTSGCTRRTRADVSSCETSRCSASPSVCIRATSTKTSTRRAAGPISHRWARSSRAASKR